MKQFITLALVAIAAACIVVADETNEFLNGEGCTNAVIAHGSCSNHFFAAEEEATNAFFANCGSCGSKTNEFFANCGSCGSKTNEFFANCGSCGSTTNAFFAHGDCTNHFFAFLN